ncbi:helix-turn-helix domain-containing protein [Rudanella paleaurantiibacter]|uniref:Helix-turn-helix domain-containing protein n=1 Tax=Rudanella paleaurantiibacter TaxID=2614655 RepID=A0A7J5TY25_9BACT|nr:helix-turn-helix transcriptional regulator [Rudanella paleaurantiibacter]KAB7729971.1 helix-turn-helix domain-containing protein [Rudanella paleaurantiibacter]
MSINDKIKQILLTKGYSPSHFADEIGVQRSSISHILSGRNRPSFDIIQKIIKRFPDLGFEWILEDDAPSPSPFNRSTAAPSSPSLRGSFLNDQAAPEPIGRAQNTLTNRTNRTEISGIRDDEYSMPYTDAIAQPANNLNQTKKKVERILIFYTDGSFQEYNPS